MELGIRRDIILAGRKATVLLLEKACTLSSVKCSEPEIGRINQQCGAEKLAHVSTRMFSLGMNLYSVH